MKYVVMMIDIKHSKKLTEIERSNYQLKLYEIVKNVNDFFSLTLKEKITFSGGDSIQGVFTNAADALVSYYFIKYSFYPYEIRCGIGYGRINEYIVASKEKYNLTDVNSNFFDGDSYHMAIDALNECKKNNYEVIIKSNDLINDLTINQLLQAGNILESMMTIKQKEIFIIFNLLSPIPIGDFFDYRYSPYVYYCLSKSLVEYKFDSNNGLLITDLDSYFKNLNIEDRIINNKNTLFTEPFSKYLNEFVAKLIKVSRENVRQMVDKGKYNEIRKMQIVALSYLNKIYSGE